jgi:dTDP-4-amino-4,6-dideoxygalactose transaminase
MSETFSKNFVPFSRPDIGQEEIDEVVAVLKSGWLTTGPRCRDFENDFAEMLGSDINTVAVNSATAGLHLVLEALGISPGDEVIVPVYTFTATAAIVCYLGATPVFVDIEEDSLNLDPDMLERAITPRTKAIIPVHFAGFPCRMDEIIGVARKNGLFVIEDAAHALPTLYKGRLVGSLDSDAAVFSFYANKTMTTGEGGMIATRNSDIATRCKVMRLHGIDQAAFERMHERYTTQEKPAWFYQVVAPGFKYNMTDLAAAIGIHQLKKIRQFQAAREAIAKRYTVEFTDLPLRLPKSCGDTDCMHAWHLYTIRLNDEKQSISREEFIDLLRARGVGTSVHFIPMFLHPFWRDTFSLNARDYPVADKAFSGVVSLPLFSAMTDEDVEFVVSTVRDVCQEHMK